VHNTEAERVSTYNVKAEVIAVVQPDSVDDPLPPRDDPNRAGVDARSARWVRRHMAAGVSVITTVHGNRYRGTTVSACIAASIEPFQLLVSIEEDSQMEEWIRKSGVFACNHLPWNEQFLADQFAGFTPVASGTFQGIPHFIGSTGAPVLENCMAWVECRVVSAIHTGDHVCFVGEAVDAGSGKGSIDDPLIYFFNRYHRLR
jgi:flavin reductase (DIM6/NTAB) family NADH-FMN oxidoreductase RutF